MMKMEDIVRSLDNDFKDKMYEIVRELQVGNALNLIKMELEAGIITPDDYRKRIENIDKMYYGN